MTKTTPQDQFLHTLAVYRARLESEQAAFAMLPETDIIARRDEFLLAVGEDVAWLIHAMAIGLGAKVIVELGTSYGFSTLFLADAARRTGGRVHSYEIASDKQDWARDRLHDAGLSDYVEWHCGDAVALLADQPGPVDLVLIDLWKDLYIPCAERLFPILAPTGVIVADNMLFPEMARADAEAYRRRVRAEPGMQAVLLAIGQGIDIATRSTAGRPHRNSPEM